MSRNKGRRYGFVIYGRCPSYLFDLPQKPWNFVSLPDTLSGMHKLINILFSVFREIFAGRAALHTEILALRQQVAVLKALSSMDAPPIASGF